MLRWQHPFEIEDTNWHRSEQLHQECEWKQGESAVWKSGEGREVAAPPFGRRSALSVTRPKTALDTGRPSHGSRALQPRAFRLHTTS